MYTESLLEFSKSPEDNVKGAAFICLLFLLAHSKVDFGHSLQEKILLRFEDIFDGPIKNNTSSYILKGSFFLLYHMK